MANICADGLSEIFDSIVPRRTRTLSGLDSFLLMMGEPQCLQKYFVLPGDDTKPVRSFSPEVNLNPVSLYICIKINFFPNFLFLIYFILSKIRKNYFVLLLLNFMF